MEASNPEAIKFAEQLLESYDYFNIKTAHDKVKLPLNKEYTRARMIIHDCVLLQPEHPTLKHVHISELIGTKPEFKDLVSTQCALLTEVSKRVNTETQ